MELNATEQRDRDILEKMSAHYYDIYNHFVNHVDFAESNRLKAITGKIKAENDGEQFGYVLNPYVGILYVLLKRLGKNSLIDLGSGAGLLLAILNAYDKELKLAGIEIEEELLVISDKLHVNAYNKDLLYLQAADIRDYEVVYFWEPFHNSDPGIKFANNLIDCMYPGQILIMRPTGKIINTLSTSKDLKPITDQRLHTFGVYNLFIKL